MAKFTPSRAAPLFGRRKKWLLLAKIADGREGLCDFTPTPAGRIFTDDESHPEWPGHPDVLDPAFDLYREDNCDIAGHIVVEHGEGMDFSGQRVAVIALWDAKGIIQPYVLHYITGLRALGYRIVLAYGVSLSLEKAASVISAAVRRTCQGYDSTSWKAAFTAFPSLFDAREVLLTNDSIFAPVGDLGRVHAVMGDVACDYWGLCESWEHMPHLQGYYVVFREKALRHETFRAVWRKVRMSNLHEDSLRLELTMSMWLALHGLIPAAYVPCRASPVRDCSPVHYFWRQMLQHGVPVLKRDLFGEWVERHYMGDWETLAVTHGYPVNLIKEYISVTPIKGTLNTVVDC